LLHEELTMPNDMTVAQSGQPNTTPTTPPNTDENPSTPTPTANNPTAVAQQLATEKLASIDKFIEQVIQKAPQGSALQTAYAEYTQNDGKLDHYERVALVHMFKASLQPSVFNAFLQQVTPLCKELGINLGQDELRSLSEAGPQYRDKSVAELARKLISDQYTQLKQQHASQNTGANRTQAETPVATQQTQTDPVLAWARQNPEAVNKAITDNAGDANGDVQEAVRQLFTTGQVPDQLKAKLADPSSSAAFDRLAQAVYKQLSAQVPQQQQHGMQTDPVLAWAAQHPDALNAAISKHAGTAGEQMQQALRQFFTTGQIPQLDGAALATFNTLTQVIYDELKSQAAPQQSQPQIQPQRVDPNSSTATQPLSADQVKQLQDTAQRDPDGVRALIQREAERLGISDRRVVNAATTLIFKEGRIDNRMSLRPVFELIGAVYEALPQLESSNAIY
jgi:hypothetical protein